MQKGLLLALAGLLSISLAHAADIIIYDAALFPPLAPVAIRGLPVLINGEGVGGRINDKFITKQAKAASENLALTRDFFLNRFGRDSFDGRGTPIEANVRVGAWPMDIFGMKENAGWVYGAQIFIFGFGDSEGFKSLSRALDVVAHEYTHAVIDFTSQLEYQGQSGALNEHLADFFGEAVEVASGRSEPGRFILGEQLVSDELKIHVAWTEYRMIEGMRDMRNPRDGWLSQPETVDEIPKKFGPSCKPKRQNDRCGVHMLSGIPSRASVLIMDELGFDTTVKLVYHTMTERLRPTSDFLEYRKELKAECEAQGVLGCDAIDEAFDAVGVK